MSQKKIPQRKCISCQDRNSKKTLIRIVKNKDGEIFVDNTGKANGRGAYICASKECLEKAMKTRALNRAFKLEIPENVYNALSEEIKKYEQ
ncbi:RNase P modulator RnpM [Tepidibacter mesophilus]|uniref:RNase P modulator RnpM n=1 Tax=Tepidibacter mesophilus TaxID=655607 RepID=UPI000C08C007|nr:YlxR family protein [Tepidibacter mesophilus]